MCSERRSLGAVCVVLALLGTGLVSAEDAVKKDGGGGPGGGPGRGGPMQFGRGQRGMMDGMFNRMLGIDQTAKVDDLPLGQAKRLVRDVPVGGVDGLQDGRDGWKVEEIFSLTPEQVQALTLLREAYKTELGKLQAEYDEAQKALAEKVKTLRQLHETKANDVLIDPAKAEKAKLDALAVEYAAQNENQVKERTVQVAEMRTNMEKTVEEARKNNNWDQMREVGGRIHTLAQEAMEQRNTLVKNTHEKMKETVTGDARAKLEELLKKNTNAGQFGRDRGGDRGGVRGGDRGGNRGGQGGETQQPPTAHENF